MWSGPRNISTTMMYSFAQRPDTEVVDEPLYAHYLTKVTDHGHPGVDEVLASQSADADAVIADLLTRGAKPVRFYKNMGHHLTGIDDWSFIDSLDNFVLTRHPAGVIRSITRNVEQPHLRDLGYQQLLAIIEHLERTGQQPIVVVSSDILLDPARVLGLLCEHLGIPWVDSMLTWDAGPRPEDGVWAKHWYANVHTSTGFRPYVANETPLDERYRKLFESAMPLYERLLEYSISS